MEKQATGMTDDFLLNVAKPGRYIGNEINMVRKSPADVLVRFAFCFPDIYEVGMSHLGMQILYYFLNRREDVYCERAFMPWTDMAGLMKEKNIPLYALETGDPLFEFDIVGFTLQHEMSFTNVLAMLDLAGIPLRAEDRADGPLSNSHPIICAGGPCAYNPEPMADFVDFFCIGDGEAIVDHVVEIYKSCKESDKSKKEFLSEISELTGVYVPAFPKSVVKKATCLSLDDTFYPDKLLVPLIETTHHRVALELFRGCKRGCRFCQAGMVQRPVRYRNPETLLAQAETLLDATGHEEISLVSLSTSDYPYFTALLTQLKKLTTIRKVNIALPSLRMDAVSLDAMKTTQEVRKSSLTFAPEAGTQRLRDVINKDITDTDISEGCRAAFMAGFDRVKLYFMTGLPTENEDDIIAIAELTHGIVDEYYRLPKEQRRRPVSVNVSCSCFVPKPHTPFQWEAQDRPQDFIEKQKIIKTKIKNKRVSYRYHDAETAVVEGVLARGDRRVGAAIEAAYKLGAVFDGWTELFRFDLWKQAFEEAKIDPEHYAYRERSVDEVLPWDFIDIGISKEMLLNERKRALTNICLTNKKNEYGSVSQKAAR